MQAANNSRLLFEMWIRLTRSTQSRAAHIDGNTRKLLAESSNELEGTKYLAK